LSVCGKTNDGAKSVYLPLRYAEDGTTKGLPLSFLIDEFPRATGLYLEDASKPNGKDKIDFTTEAIENPKTARDFELNFQPVNGWKFDATYQVDYELGTFNCLGNSN
jgi:hypothetical protein